MSWDAFDTWAWEKQKAKGVQGVKSIDFDKWKILHTNFLNRSCLHQDIRLNQILALPQLCLLEVTRIKNSRWLHKATAKAMWALGIATKGDYTFTPSKFTSLKTVIVGLFPALLMKIWKGLELEWAHGERDVTLYFSRLFTKQFWETLTRVLGALGGMPKTDYLIWSLDLESVTT